MTCNIYKLTCNDPELIYYGSTIRKLNDRLVSHKSEYKHRNQILARKLFEVGNVKIHLLEECSIDKRYEREDYYIRNFPCVNKKFAIGDRKYTDKKYYENNKDKCNERSKEKYYRKWEEYHQTTTCECGSEVQKYNLNKHKKTKKHQSNLTAHSVETPSEYK